MKRAQKYADFRDYEHYVGRWWMLTGSLLLLAVPTAICVVYDAWPPITDLLRGLLGVAPIYWTVGTIEVLTYVPMLGTGGSYLGFLTGNLTSLKVPCALNAMQACGVEAGTEEGIDQRRFLAGEHATNLQVAAVGKLQHATGMLPRCLGNRPRLGAAQHAARQLDAADATVQRRHDAQQAGAGGRADGCGQAVTCG